MNKPVFLYAALILFAAGALGADLGWEGSAVVGRRGAFPPEGYYGASNSFPRNSVVTVTNLETGRSVDLIIATRVNEPGVFLAVSDEAGDHLGMDPSVPSRVRVVPVETRVASPVVTPPVRMLEQPLSADPDINPAAALSDPDQPTLLAEAVSEPETQPVPPIVVSEPQTGNGRSGLAQGVFRTAGVIPAADPDGLDSVGEILHPSEKRVVEMEESGPDPRLEATPIFTETTVHSNRMEEAVASVRGRTPPKELFPPPREDEVFTFLDVPRGLTLARPVDRRLAEAPAPDTDGVRIVDRPAAESLGKLEEPRRPLMVELPTAEAPAVAAVAPEAEAEPEPEVAPIVDPAPTVESEPETPSDRIAESAEPTAPAEPDNGVVLRLEPAEPRPPVAEAESPVAEPVAPASPVSPVAPTAPPAGLVTVDEWALASLPLSGELDTASYYLQVGAFASPRSARNVIDRFESGYPFTVTTVELESRTVFRVFVGPLSQDETGLMLREIRSRGYRDAFVRNGGV